MELAARRSMLAAAALTTAGALALAPVTVTPPDLHAALSPIRVSTQAVALTDAWYDLLNNTLLNVGVLGELFLGGNNTWPLPNPTIPLAPIATQLVLNPLIYAVQLLTGDGAQIPGEISTHLSQLAGVAQLVVTEVPPILFKQIQTPFVALQLAIDYVATATNKLIALLNAPAVFLDFALNSNYGLFGGTGVVAVPILIRNLLAKAIDTPLPTITLPFKKASGAEAKAPTPKAAAVTASSGTAGSARNKPKASSPAAASAKKSDAKKSSTAKAGSGVGRGKR